MSWDGRVSPERRSDGPRLSDWWWLFRPDQPHRYVCPFLMTLSCWIYRLLGKPAYWYPATKNSKGEWVSPAMVLIRNWEPLGFFPRWMVEKECDFWNSMLGVKLRSRHSKGWTFGHSDGND